MSMKLFAAVYTYDPDNPLIEEYRPAHREFIGKLAAQGTIHGSGPFTDGSGGALIVLSMCQQSTLADAKAIMNNDPFFIHGAIDSRSFHTWNPVINSFGYDPS